MITKKSTFKSIALGVLLSLSTTTFGQSVFDEWKPLLNDPRITTYFSGMFNSMGFHIKETGEEFTVHHKGDHFVMVKGVNKDSVDYFVKLKVENILNLRKHAKDEKIDGMESYRIMRALFSPLTEASLTSPVMIKPSLRKMAGIEDHTHVTMTSPDGKDSISHTLIYLDREWMVIPGKWGHAKRVFHITQEDAIIYQREVFKAMSTNTIDQWKKFRDWYLAWREKVSVKIEKKK